jgi:hypothetical protein
MVAITPRNRLVPGFYNNPPFLQFLRHNWLDIFTQLLCLFIALLLYSFCPPLLPRYFPIFPGVETTSWGLKHGQPLRAEYLNTWVMAVMSYAVPAAIMGAIGLWFIRDFNDGNAAVSYCSPHTEQLRNH